jgi:amidase
MPSLLLHKPATELAALVRRGDVSARDLVQASLDRIEATRSLNHWTLVDAEGALAAADAVAAGDERPFAGVPIAVKDLFAPVAGLRSAHGSHLLGEYTPDYDNALVRRLREAGFVILGKTQTPELGIQPITASRRFGAARNPWDPERTPGGSSGGSAGAVAAGAVPVAHGSDGGGSIRSPAACCGLVGLKPARGRISHAPDLGDNLLGTEGALTRTTTDAAALLDVMAGYEPGDATWAPPPQAPFAELARRSPGSLRVALALDNPIGAALDPECERGACEAAELLAGLGHHVEEIEAPWKDSDLAATFGVLWAVGVASAVRHGEAVTGNAPSAATIEPLTEWLYARGKAASALEHRAAVTKLQAFARVVVSLWSRFDLLVVPALAQRPPRHGEIDACGPDPEREFDKGFRFNPYSPLFNVTGQPAVSVPLFHGDDGLPTAAQIVGPPAGEALVLQVCRQLEEARPWADRIPPEPPA